LFETVGRLGDRPVLFAVAAAIGSAASTTTTPCSLYAPSRPAAVTGALAATRRGIGQLVVEPGTIRSWLSRSGGGTVACVTRARPGRRELLGVALLFTTFLVTTFVTYSRIPAADLYHVTLGGPVGGLSRVLWEVNFPDALIAVPLCLLALDVLQTRWATAAATSAIAACLVVAIPGVVDQGHIEARAINAIPAVGVALTAALLVAAWPHLGTAVPRLRGDVARLALAVVLVLAAFPYWFAELGFYAPDPVLADEPSPNEDIAAVHLGSHEGMDGTLLALAVLALSRLTPSFRSRRLASGTSAILAGLLAYGIANLVEDDWLEQVWKRGWTDVKIPSLVRPQLSVGWAVVLAAGAAIEVLWFRRERHFPAP
jgi:hypothetical protein